MKLIFVTLTIMLLALSSNAKKNCIVKIGDHEYSTEEFERIYKKNNSQLNDESEIKSPEEYMDLFINYKLKVIEAQNRGMDTLSSFINELKGYRDELAKPYLTDISYTDSLVKLAYYRTVNEIKASHILINVNQNADPKDTLKAYQKAMDIRQKFLDGEESFGNLAVQFSEDPSAKQNKGDLGYFNAFSMVTPFEDGAYNTAVGEVSKPVRTRYGYHLIYVTDLAPVENRYKVAHIMKIFRNRQNTAPEEEQYTNELKKVYEELNQGANWEEMVEKHSDDQGSISKGGNIGYVTRSLNVVAFYDQVTQLSEAGEISKPFASPYGVHIVKLLETSAVDSFEDMKNELVEKVKKDPQRSQHSKSSFIGKIKKEYDFKAYRENLEILRDYVNEAADSIHLPLDKELSILPLFQIEDSVLTVESFLSSLPKQNNSLPAFLVLEKLPEIENSFVTAYEDSKLEEKHDDFRYIVQEYHDGILLFAIMQEEVWDKAVSDSIGLQNFYENNPNLYTWEKHFDGILYKGKTVEAIESLKSLMAQGISNPDSLLKSINKDQKILEYTKHKWEKGDNDVIDFLYFNGEKPKTYSENLILSQGEMINAGEPKTLDQAKGLYISDYQDILEKRWIESLRNKYSIEINKRQLRKVKSLTKA